MFVRRDGEGVIRTGRTRVRKHSKRAVATKPLASPWGRGVSYAENNINNCTVLFCEADGEGVMRPDRTRVRKQVEREVISRLPKE